MSKTIITDSYRGTLALMKSAFASAHHASGDVRILSLNNLLMDESPSEEVLLLRLSHVLKPLQSECPVYGKMFSYPAFCSEILAFARECVLYGVQPDQLPRRMEMEQELQKILQAAMSLDLPEKNILLKVQSGDLFHHGDLTYLPGSFPDVWHARLLEKMFPDQKNQEKLHPSCSFVQDRTPHQEIEAIAQSICLNPRSTNVILTSPSDQMPVVQEVFGRYGIPFNAIAVSEDALLHQKYSALAEFSLYKDADHLFKAVQLDAFSVPFPADLLPFLEETLTQCQSPQGMAEALHLAHGIYERQARSYQAMEEKCGEWFRRTEEERNLLLEAKTPQDVLCSAFEVLRHIPGVSGMKEIHSLRSTLQDCLPLAETEDDAVFLLSHLKDTKQSSDIITNDFCTVTDLRHPVDPADVSYVVSCSEENYPGFQARTGLFDEEYTAQISSFGFPDLEERHGLYMKQMEWVNQSAREEIIWSCPSGDYEGREIQIARTLKEQFDLDHHKPERRKPVQLSLPGSSLHALFPGTMQSLLFHDQKVLTTSVSAMEKYYSCPYAWFLESGLHIHEKPSTTLEASSSGTIQHAFLEDSLNRFHKGYADRSENEIRDFIHPVFDALAACHPGETELIRIMEERMCRSLNDSLAWLKDYEADNDFIPSAAEWSFGRTGDTWNEDFSEHVHLQGSVDRIDLYHNMVRILDYKSSPHNLNAKRIQAGLQMQLLCYMITVMRALRKQPAGAFYFSLKDEYLKPSPYISQGRGKSRTFEDNGLLEEDMKEERVRARMLKGWIFTDDDGFVPLDHDGRHVYHGRGKSVTSHDISQVEEAMTDLSEHFYQQVSAGDMRVDPVEGACTYCAFRCICRFNGRQRKPEPVRKGEEI